MTAEEIVRAARDRIANPTALTADTMAKDVTGNAVDARSQDAAAWCAIGALDAVTAERDAVWFEAFHAVEAAAGVRFPRTLTAASRDAAHSVILGWFEAAADRLKNSELGTNSESP